MTDTAQPQRRAGKRGRREVQHYPNMALGNFQERGTAEPPPPQGNVTKGITSWLMLGNDEYGCCGPSATEHNRMAKAATGAAADGTGLWVPGFTAPTTVQTLALYFAYGRAMGWPTQPGMPGPDQGVDNGSWLAFLKQAGVIELFAELDATDANAVHQGMLDYHGVIVGVLLTDQADSEFENHRPWNIGPGEPVDPNMGHDILLVEYDTTAADAADTFVTWGELQPTTVAWQQGESVGMDAWVIMTKEDGNRTGVDTGALEAEISRIEVDYHEGLVQEVIDWLKKEWRAIV